jgi:hypothetical protein
VTGDTLVSESGYSVVVGEWGAVGGGEGACVPSPTKYEVHH